MTTIFPQEGRETDLSASLYACDLRKRGVGVYKISFAVAHNTLFMSTLMWYIKLSTVHDPLYARADVRPQNTPDCFEHAYTNVEP